MLPQQNMASSTGMLQEQAVTACSSTAGVNGGAQVSEQRGNTAQARTSQAQTASRPQQEPTARKAMSSEAQHGMFCIKGREKDMREASAARYNAAPGPPENRR